MNEWLRKIVSKGAVGNPPQPEAPAEHQAEPLGAVERDAIVTRHLSQHLPPLGLTRLRP